MGVNFTDSHAKIFSRHIIVFTYFFIRYLIRNNNRLMKEKSLAPLDTTNPRSLVNLVPDIVKQCIDGIPQEYFGLDVTEYEKEIAPGPMLTQTDRRLRLAFWLEYERAQNRGIEMNMKRVIDSACSHDFFYKAIKNPKKMGYYLIPPVNYSSACDDLLERSILVLGRILDQVVNARVIDSKMAEVAMKIFNAIDARKNGAVVQRVEQKNLNVNVDAATPESLSLEDVKKRLMELEQKSPEPKVIEVKAE